MTGTSFDYAAAQVPVRADLAAGHARAGDRLANAGTWWTGEQRLAIAAEARHAVKCRLCRERLTALSPYTVEGEHDSLGGMAAPLVELIHRLRTDPGRLTRRWYDGIIAAGIRPEHYVETVGVVVTSVAVDTFARGIPAPPWPLPPVKPGHPTQLRPAATQGTAYVPWLEPEAAGPAEADLYPPGRAPAHIYKAMSLVPAEVRGFFADLVNTQYLPAAAMRDFDREFRAISHAQIEFLAARVSALNRCEY